MKHHGGVDQAVYAYPRDLDGWEAELGRPLHNGVFGENLTSLGLDVNGALIGEGQLDLERHRGRTPGGVAVRVLQRILALTAAIWHNDHTGQPVMRALTAYDD